MIRLCLCLFLAVVTGQAANAQQSVRSHKAGNHESLRYLLYMPKAETQLADGFPLVLFLHGGGEGGNDIRKVTRHGPPKLIEQGKQFPFIVVSPQNPSETQFWDDQQIIRLLDELESELPVDKSRVYLTGLSRGGYGVWRTAIQNPDRFAALVPISGGGAVPYAKKLIDVPTWVFHGAKDPVIPIVESQRMVDALREAGCNVNFTIYPEAKHDAWTAAYDNPELYKWLLDQKLAVSISSTHAKAPADQPTAKTEEAVPINTGFPGGGETRALID